MIRTLGACLAAETATAAFSSFLAALALDLLAFFLVVTIAAVLRANARKSSHNHPAAVKLRQSTPCHIPTWGERRRSEASGNESLLRVFKTFRVHTPVNWCITFRGWVLAHARERRQRAGIPAYARSIGVGISPSSQLNGLPDEAPDAPPSKPVMMRLHSSRVMALSGQCRMHNASSSFHLGWKP